MSPITIIDNEYVTLQYLPDSKVIYHTIHKPVPAAQLIELMNAGTEALQQYGACKWLSDDRNSGPLPPEFMEWVFQGLGERSIAAGWKYWANVVPQDIAAAGTLAKAIDALYEMGLHMMVFTDLEEATRWINKMKD